MARNSHNAYNIFIVERKGKEATGGRGEPLYMSFCRMGIRLFRKPNDFRSS